MLHKLIVAEIINNIQNAQPLNKTQLIYVEKSTCMQDLIDIIVEYNNLVKSFVDIIEN